MLMFVFKMVYFIKWVLSVILMKVRIVLFFFFLELQHKEMVDTGDFVEESGPVLGDLGAEESDTEEGKGGTDDSSYETEEEATTETESEDEVLLNTS